MSHTAEPTVLCPTCQREVRWTESSPWRPFCSQRCRMVDLGAWFNGERSIAGEPADPVDAVNPAGTSTTNDNTQR